jgi:hypothetical protein
MAHESFPNVGGWGGVSVAVRSYAVASRDAPVKLARAKWLRPLVVSFSLNMSKWTTLRMPSQVPVGAPGLQLCSRATWAGVSATVRVYGITTGALWQDDATGWPQGSDMGLVTLVAGGAAGKPGGLPAGGGPGVRGGAVRIP